MTFDSKPGEWREVQNRAILAIKTLGGCLAAKVESYECFSGQFGDIPPTHHLGTLRAWYEIWLCGLRLSFESRIEISCTQIHSFKIITKVYFKLGVPVLNLLEYPIVKDGLCCLLQNVRQDIEV